MNWLFLIIFIIFSVIHLYASLKRNIPLRGVTKIVLLLALLAYYAVEVGPENVSWTVVLAVIFSWLGDILLIPHGVKWFTVGGIAFWISHFLFIASYCQYTDFTLVPWYYIALFGVIDVAVVTYIFKYLKQYLPKPLVIPMYFYLMTNGAMNCFAIYRLISGIAVGDYLTAAITVIGALMFFISDSSLFFVRFNKNCRMKTHFIVMTTYILAEFLIVLGFIL